MSAITNAVGRRQATHAALDGGRVEIGGTRLDLGSQPSSIATFLVNGVAQEFTASYREFGKDRAADLGVPFIEEYSFQGGRLRLASGSRAEGYGAADAAIDFVPLHLGTWEGAQYSVHTLSYGTFASDLVGIFDQFNIVETARGIRLIQKKPRPFVGGEPKVLKEIPSLGLLQIRRLTKIAARVVPRWPGTPVLGGELFKKGEADLFGDSCGKVSFYLASPTALTFIAPDPDGSLAEALDLLADLSVDWHQGPR
jgi:hypothetical protein